MRQVLCKANDTCNFLDQKALVVIFPTLLVSFISLLSSSSSSVDSAISTFDTNHICALSVQVYAIISHSIAHSLFPIFRRDFISENPFILPINHWDLLNSHVSSYDKAFYNHATVTLPANREKSTEAVVSSSARSDQHYYSQTLFKPVPTQTRKRPSLSKHEM